MYKIPTLWQPANWLKIIALIGAFIIGLMKVFAEKLPSPSRLFSVVAAFTLLACSLAVLAIALELPPQMTMSTAWRWAELSAYVGMIFAAFMLAKALDGNTRRIHNHRQAFGQMRM